MTETFEQRWRSKLHAMGQDSLSEDLVACGEWKLPRSAPPCLEFACASNPLPIWEIFGIPTDWSSEDRDRLRRFRVIGTDGAGNPICHEEGSGEVWILDHEDEFRSKTFVNRSVNHLADCILAYMGETNSDRFRDVVKRIDPPAIAEGSMWWNEANAIGV